MNEQVGDDPDGGGYGGGDVAAEVRALQEAWEAERPGLDLRTLWLSLPLRRVMQAAEARRADLLADHGLTPAAFDLLVALRRVGPPYARTPGQLGRDLVLSSGGVSQRLERLERAGLIERRLDRGDRRVVRVKLTRDGLSRLDTVMDEYVAQEEELFAALDPEQRHVLSGLLCRLAGAAPADAEPTPGGGTGRAVLVSPSGSGGPPALDTVVAELGRSAQHGGGG